MEKPPSNVVSLEDRRIARANRIEVAADLEERLVALAFVHPDLGEVSVGLEVHQVVQLVEALISAGAKVASSRWTRWSGHVGVMAPADFSFRAAAETFVRRWRNARPNVLMRPAASQATVRRVAESTARLAANRLTDPEKDTDAFVARILAHLSYDGNPLGDRIGCDRFEAHEELPWDHLL